MKFDYEKFEEELDVLIARDIIEECEAFGVGHYRIAGKLDIWPRRRKYFYQPTREHGEYDDLETFLSQIFEY